MPDDNRFAGLGDAVDGPDGAESTADQPTEPSDDQPTEPPDDQPTEPPDETSGAGPARDASSDDGGPAFSFDATTQESIYVREETIEALDDAEFEVQARLRSDHDLRDLTGREFQDAVLRVAARHPDAIVEAILEAREE